MKGGNEATNGSGITQFAEGEQKTTPYSPFPTPYNLKATACRRLPGANAPRLANLDKNRSSGSFRSRAFGRSRLLDRAR